MSAESCWVTCGMVAQAALRCCAVFRRTARMGCISTSPHREKSGSASAAIATVPAGADATLVIRRLAWAFTSSIEIRPLCPVPAT